MVQSSAEGSCELKSIYHWIYLPCDYVQWPSYHTLVWTVLRKLLFSLYITSSISLFLPQIMQCISSFCLLNLPFYKVSRKLSTGQIILHTTWYFRLYIRHQFFKPYQPSIYIALCSSKLNLFANRTLHENKQTDVVFANDQLVYRCCKT